MSWSKLKLLVELNLVDYFVKVTARLRWDEANELPQTRVRSDILSPIMPNFFRYSCSFGSRFFSFLEAVLRLRMSRVLPASLGMSMVKGENSSQLRPLIITFSARKLHQSTPHIPRHHLSYPSSPITIQFFHRFRTDPAEQMVPMGSYLHP